MVRRLAYGIALVLLAAALGRGLWLSTGSNPAAPDSGFRCTGELMRQWSAYAGRVPLPREQILDSPEKVVELMNAHAPLAFGGPEIRFVLWKAGDAPVPGYRLNPHRENREQFDQGIHAMRHSPEYWSGATNAYLPSEIIPGLVDSEPNGVEAGGAPRGNTLDEQTSVYLLHYQYRTALSGNRVFVFRQDAFLPHLITQRLYVLSGAMMQWMLNFRPAYYSVEPDGRWNIRPYLELQGIHFEPGASAYYDPKDQVATLTLDEDNLELASITNFSGGCIGGAEAASSKSERFKLKFEYWREEQWSLLCGHLGLPPVP